MNKDGITVIIPCYNVEKFVEKCLIGLENQTYKNLEIIMVDDKSKDNTIGVIEKIIESTTLDIKLLKNEVNSGAGFSRNRAIKEAKYDIISFIDSDDYIENNYYSSMLKSMKKDNADIAVCDIFVRYSENVPEVDVRSQALVGDNKKINFINNGLAASPCNKLFKKELLIKFPFAEGIMNEDIPTVISCLSFAKRITYISDTYYNYVQHDASVQNKKISKKRFDIFKALDILETRIKNCNNFDKIWTAVIYNQIIMFFLYVLPKEKNVFIRTKYYRMFYKLSKKYKIRRNNLLWNYLEMQGRYHKYYYKLLLKLNDNGLSFLTSLTVFMYDEYVRLFRGPVIKKNITIDDVILKAKYQNKLNKSNSSVSVVIPNYNYERFMYQRLYSILNQSIKINEIIILDDCSSDDSRKTIDDIVDRLKDYVDIKKVYNEKNSGSAFKQWEKGFNIANSKYVWIAEADDYCNNKFLRSVMAPFNDKDVVISYANTAFIDVNGKIIYKSVVPDIDLLNTGHWDNSYINDGKSEIKNYSYLNCTIANVSSVVFKKDDYSDYFKMSGKYRQAGDWLFYINVMSNGKVAFNKHALNYYRIHGNNVTSNTKYQKHLDEIEKIYDYISENFSLDKFQKKNMQGRIKFLKKTWHLK